MEEKTIKYEALLKVVRRLNEEEKIFDFFLYACESGDLELCQLCLDAGASINIRQHGDTLLQVLVSKGTFTTEVADWLINKGLDINLTSFGDTPLSTACKKGKIDIARYLFDKGAQIHTYHQSYEFEDSDLINAVEGGHLEIVKFLFEKGCDLEKELLNGRNPFVRAVKFQKSEIVEFFLQKGVAPNDYGIGGGTLLHLAVSKKDIKTAELLLKYKADVNAKLEEDSKAIDDYLALTPMDIALYSKDIEMQKLLAEYGGEASSKVERIQALCAYDQIVKVEYFSVKINKILAE